MRANDSLAPPRGKRLDGGQRPVAHCRARGFGVMLSIAPYEERTKAPIRRPAALSERLREETNMASLSNWSLHGLTHRREIRSVASAFVGEIAAILHLIETHDVVSMVEKALDAPGRAAALPNLMLPAFTIYTADAARLMNCRYPCRAKSPIFMRRLRRSGTTSRGSRESLSRKARSAVKPSAYDASSPNSMTRWLSAMIFFASCGRFFRRNIRIP
jgi:hypothetical protein